MRRVLSPIELEHRVMPVVGAFEIPVALSNTTFPGVVEIGELDDTSECTGALLRNGRFVLTAAHCVDDDGDLRADAERYSVRFDLPTGNVVLSVPRSDVFIAPQWLGSSNIVRGNDLALLRLPSLAPFGDGPQSIGYTLFTQKNEINQMFNFVGYGAVGTGTTGESVNPEATTAEIQRLRIDGGAGSVTLGYNGRSAIISQPFTEDSVGNALSELLPDVDGNIYLVNSPNNPNNGSFEVVFDSIVGNAEQLTLTPGPGFVGTLGVQTLVEGGTANVKREGVNTVARILSGGILESDFPSRAGFGVLGGGDSGGPAFINGQIAGIASFGSDSTMFGANTDWARVSSFVDSFINPTINNSRSELVLDMNTQPIGRDGRPDTIRLFRDAGQIAIDINGVRYLTASETSFTGIRIRGSADGTAFQQNATIGIPINLENTSSTVQPQAMKSYRAFAAGPGGGPVVRVQNFDGTDAFLFFAYTPTFTGGVRVATGDVTGDGTPDIVTVPGPGGASHVKVFDGVSGLEVGSFFGFDPMFFGGAYVTVSDVDGDGFEDIILGAGEGGGPRVQIFSGRTGTAMSDFFAYASTFRGGVRVTSADFDGDGLGDIATSPGGGGGPHVRLVRGKDLGDLGSFFAYAPNIIGGLNLSAGDIDGDGKAEIFAGPGNGFGPVVSIFNANGSARGAYFAFPPTPQNGLRLAFIEDRATNSFSLMVTPDANGSVVNIIDPASGMVKSMVSPFGAPLTGGIFVG